MKHYLYSLCFLIATIGFSACSKSNDPAPVSPVVGRWELNKALLSGFAAPNTSLNGGGLDLYNGFFTPLASQFDIRTDNSFLESIKRGGVAGDLEGTWVFSNNQLNLTYNNGDTDSFTYKQTGALEELTSVTTYDITLPVDSVTTAKGKFQYVYRK